MSFYGRDLSRVAAARSLPVGSAPQIISCLMRRPIMEPKVICQIDPAARARPGERGARSAVRASYLLPGSRLQPKSRQATRLEARELYKGGRRRRAANSLYEPVVQF